MQLVLPLLLATAMAAFAASAWKVADDWRVSKAAATVGADDGLLHRHRRRRGCCGSPSRPTPRASTSRPPCRPAPRTVDGGRVALVDASRFARVAAWDSQWGTSAERGAGLADVARRRRDPIRFSGDARPGGADTTSA